MRVRKSFSMSEKKARASLRTNNKILITGKEQNQMAKSVVVIQLLILACLIGV